MATTFVHETFEHKYKLYDSYDPVSHPHREYVIEELDAGTNSIRKKRTVTSAEYVQFQEDLKAGKWKQVLNEG